MQPFEPKAIRWTRAEYYTMARAGLFEGRRVELIRGAIIETAPQDTRHAAAVRLADYALRPVFGQGFLLSIQLPLSLGLDSDLEPDLAIVAGRPRDFLDAHPTSAVLVVEVSGSSLRYDRETKGSLYAEAGIQEYWIVNLVDRRLEVYRAPVKEKAGRFVYTSQAMLTGSDTISPIAASKAHVKGQDLLP